MHHHFYHCAQFSSRTIPVAPLTCIHYNNHFKRCEQSGTSAFLVAVDCLFMSSSLQCYNGPWSETTKFNGIWCRAFWKTTPEKCMWWILCWSCRNVCDTNCVSYRRYFELRMWISSVYRHHYPPKQMASLEVPSWMTIYVILKYIYLFRFHFGAHIFLVWR